MLLSKGFVFDVDGTLVDSNDAHAHAWRHAFMEAGLAVGFEPIRRLIGKGSDKLLAELTGLDADSPRAKGLAACKTEIFTAYYLPRLKPFPHARDLLVFLSNHDIKLAVATSASPEELDALLDVVKVRDMLDVKVTGEDAGRSKPDPDPVSCALRKLGLKPLDCVMVGDTPYDAAAAKAAGVRFIGLRCGGWRDSDLQPAMGVYSAPADLLKTLRAKQQPQKVVTEKLL